MGLGKEKKSLHTYNVSEQGPFHSCPMSFQEADYQEKGAQRFFTKDLSSANCDQSNVHLQHLMTAFDDGGGRQVRVLLPKCLINCDAFRNCLSRKVPLMFIFKRFELLRPS